MNLVGLSFFFNNPNIRNITIPGTLVGKVVYIYNGKFLNYLYITSKKKW